LFLFQAEDGIRDFHVTGVQTCALPISDAATDLSATARARIETPASRRLDRRAIEVAVAAGRLDLDIGGVSVRIHADDEHHGPLEIGRASCREVVSILVVTSASTHDAAA